jgi:hypothetical protein
MQLSFKFDVHGPVHRKYIPIYVQQDTPLHSLFISEDCSTCFGCYFHLSSEAHTTLCAPDNRAHRLSHRYCVAVTVWQMGGSNTRNM